jgi:hypothetical protein
MFYGEHNPPHFHAQYGEHHCCIDIRTLFKNYAEITRIFYYFCTLSY